MCGKLNDDRKHRLEQLPGWTWKPRDDRWERSFAALEQYVTQNGNANPSKSTIQDGSGRSVQRIAFKQGTLSADPEERLANIPGWTWNAMLHA